MEPGVRLGLLYSNNIGNIEAKFEVLENASVLDIVKVKGEKYWLRDYFC